MKKLNLEMLKSPKVESSTPKVNTDRISLKYLTPRNVQQMKQIIPKNALSPKETKFVLQEFKKRVKQKYNK